MKTSLLFILALVVGLAVSAQKSVKVAPENVNLRHMHASNIIEKEITPLGLIPNNRPVSAKKSVSDVQRVLFASSLNLYSIQDQDQTCMYYNKELDVIMGTYRGNQVGTSMILGTGNDICNYWSTDVGSTFTGKIALPGSADHGHRYPSGAIYNLPGNTDLSQAFSVMSGPEVIGGAFTNEFLSCVQYNGENFDVKYAPVHPNPNVWEYLRQGLMTTTNGYAHVCCKRYTADYTISQNIVYNGKFNANTYVFDWDSITLQEPFYKTPEGLYRATTWYTCLAWTKDGSVGYMLSIGTDNRTPAGANFGYYPILHKSVDNGKTWQLMDYFDFSTLPEVYPHINDTHDVPGVAIPFFNEADMVVDANGNPHIFALCQGQWTTEADSTNNIFAHDKGAIFEFYYTGSTWKSIFIKYPQSSYVPTASSPMINSTGNVGWDMRLQASRTDDGKKVFAVWTDTDWKFWAQTDSINLNPDVFIWGRDIVTNKNTVVKNLTELTDAYGLGFFMLVSPITRDKDGVYDIPLSITDINTYSPPNADAEMYHYFLKGASFTEADFNLVGVDKGIKTEPMAANVYPNPFRGEAKISFTLDKPSNVQVVITSVTGKQVKSVNFGNLSGRQNLSLDASNLPGGVYFCTIMAGDKKVTSKMVVK